MPQTIGACAPSQLAFSAPHLPAPRWQAELQLVFARDGHATVLRHYAHHGPLRVQRPFYDPAGTCQVYVLHPPGGVAGGDELRVQAETRAAATALLTTPGATKFYRSDARLALQLQDLVVGPHATLEWVPQETIVFDGAHAEMRTHVQLAPSSRFIGWEVTCLGRPASGERFVRGRWRQRFELWQGDVPLLLERADHTGGALALDAPWGWRGLPVSATLVAYPAAASTLVAARDALRASTSSTPELVSSTLMGQVLVCRYLGRSTQRAREIFTQLWTTLRPALLQRPAYPPRIWST